MSAPHERALRARQWMVKAEHDLTNAENTLKMGEDCPLDTVCFHAQQCAEKALKAVLVAHGRDFPKTHDVVVLVRLVQEIQPSARSAPPLHPLNRYTIEARYPGDWDPINRQEAEQAVAMARAVREFVDRLLPADQPKPGR